MMFFTAIAVALLVALLIAFIIRFTNAGKFSVGKGLGTGDPVRGDRLRFDPDHSRIVVAGTIAIIVARGITGSPRIVVARIARGNHELKTVGLGGL
jgi:hypothetical protein